MIRWYRERGHYTQAVTLFREWLVSLVGWALTGEYLLMRDEREQVESCLGYLQARARKPQARPRGEVREDFLEKVGTLNWRQELLDTLGPITEVRNNIAHCGMGRREGAPRYAKIIDKLVDGPLGASIEKSGSAGQKPPRWLARRGRERARDAGGQCPAPSPGGGLLAGRTGA